MEVLVEGWVCSEGHGGAGGLCRTPPVFVGRQQRGCLGKGQGPSCGPGDRTVIASSLRGPVAPACRAALWVMPWGLHVAPSSGTVCLARSPHCLAWGAAAH